MDATAYPGHFIRKCMTLHGLVPASLRLLLPAETGPNILMNNAIPECHLFSYAQPKPNKGHRVGSGSEAPTSSAQVPLARI
jgi:hypothetical protein